MTYEEFLKFVPSRCMHEAIYDDSDGCTILVIRMLDAYGMVNKAQQQWIGLTDEEIQTAWDSVMDGAVFTRKEVYKAIEAKLKEKNEM